LSRLWENAGTPGTAPSAAEQKRDLFEVSGNVTHKDSWTPNTLTKQGAKLTATWEDAGDDLPSKMRLEPEVEGPG
jgi:DNA processing protein